MNNQQRAEVAKQKAIDMVDKIFGRLTVKSLSSKLTNRGAVYIDCDCLCGNKTTVRTVDLINGKTKSCGCLQAETAKYRDPELALLGMIKSRRISEDPKVASSKKAYYNYRDGDLTLEDFLCLSQKNCFYCGGKPSNCSNSYGSRKITSQLSADRKMNADFIYNGLDRVDNTRPHNKDNVVPCCKVCNIAKNNMTSEEFYNWIIRVYDMYHTRSD